MNKVYEKVLDCVRQIREKTDFVPDMALVLGSGLGGYGEHIQIEKTISYSEIEGFPISTVPGHVGRFIFGTVNGVKVVCMQGRIHYYEGYSMQDVVLPIRVMKMLGARVLFLSNACGGIQRGMQAGDLMMLTDHIGFFIPNPLIGANIDELGERFVDMSEVYDKDLRKIIRQSAMNLDLDLKEGVYCQYSGPTFETPAEIAMLRTLGADAVGMSTVCEAIAANHMGMKICAISLVTNLAAGITSERLSHEDVQKAADQAGKKFEALVTEVITNIGKTF